MEAALFAGLAVAALFVVGGAERLQLGVLNGRRAELSGPQLAFDEAFRVSTVLSQVMLAPMLIALADALCLRAVHDGGLWPRLLFMGWTAGVVCGALVLNAVVAAPEVRRYYRRRLPLSRVPESAPC